MFGMEMTVERRRVLAGVAVPLLGLTLPLAAHAADLETDRLRATLDGVYALEEWHTDSGVFRPPQVDGRFAVINGGITLVLHNRIQEASPTTVAAWGNYRLDKGTFHYGYLDWSVFAQPASGITVSRKLPWEGMRTFAASREGDALRLSAESGDEMLFSAEGIRFSQKGKLLRVWRRLQP